MCIKGQGLQQHTKLCLVFIHYVELKFISISYSIIFCFLFFFLNSVAPKHHYIPYLNICFLFLVVETKSHMICEKTSVKTLSWKVWLVCSNAELSQIPWVFKGFILNILVHFLLNLQRYIASQHTCGAVQHQSFASMLV